MAPAKKSPRKKAAPKKKSKGTNRKNPAKNFAQDLRGLLLQAGIPGIDSPEDLPKLLELISGQTGFQLSLPKETTPYDQAEAMAERAWAETDFIRRGKLAKQAIKICADSVQAWLALASATENPHEAEDLLGQAVEVGKRQFPASYFDDEVGKFWLIVETRPYMEAVEALATFHLESRQDPETASVFYQDLLRLNPTDNQGIRHRLFRCLLETRDYPRLESVLSKYDEDTAETNYARFLWRFATGGPEAAAPDFQKAYDQNRYVVLYLLGMLPPPDGFAPYYESGSQEEAIHCLANLIPAFEETTGALEWIGATVGPQFLEHMKKTNLEVAMDPTLPVNIRTLLRLQIPLVALTARIVKAEMDGPALLEAAKLLEFIDEDDNLALGEDDVNNLFDFFVHDFEIDGVTPIQKLHAADGGENEEEKAVLNAMVNATTSIYRVEGKNKRKGIVKLSDLLNPGRTIELTDPQLAETCRLRQGVFMRLLEIDGIAMNSGVIYPFDSFGLTNIVREIPRKMNAIRRKHPHLSEAALRFLAIDELSLEAPPWFT